MKESCPKAVKRDANTSTSKTKGIYILNCVPEALAYTPKPLHSSPEPIYSPPRYSILPFHSARTVGSTPGRRRTLRVPYLSAGVPRALRSVRSGPSPIRALLRRRPAKRVLLYAWSYSVSTLVTRVNQRSSGRCTVLPVH